MIVSETLTAYEGLRPSQIIQDIEHKEANEWGTVHALYLPQCEAH